MKPNEARSSSWCRSRWDKIDATAKSRPQRFPSIRGQFETKSVAHPPLYWLIISVSLSLPLSLVHLLSWMVQRLFQSRNVLIIRNWRATVFFLPPLSFCLSLCLSVFLSLSLSFFHSFFLSYKAPMTTRHEKCGHTTSRPFHSPLPPVLGHGSSHTHTHTLSHTHTHTLSHTHTHTHVPTHTQPVLTTE